MVIIAAFYHFFDFPRFAEKRADILAIMKRAQVKGSILIAAEGFNGTIAGPREGIDKVLNYLRDEIALNEFNYKESSSDKPPFPRTKVRLKKETISLGEPCPPDLVGDYIEAKDWNDFISRDDVLLLDARNAYETHLGSFKNATLPNTKKFKQLPGFIRGQLQGAKQQKIATFCTGGIRCEKLTSWMKSEGFEQVYHLKGGILKYLEEIPQEESLWNGECYVFDHRIAVGHGIIPSQTTTMCHCGHPLLPEDLKHPSYVEAKACGFCCDAST